MQPRSIPSWAGHYPGFGSVNGDQNNAVEEEIWAAYAQVELNTELAGRPVNVVAGVRYEHTTSTSSSLVVPPSALRWDADNDFTTVLAPNQRRGHRVEQLRSHPAGARHLGRHHRRPQGRVSYGKTIARPDFASLFSAVGIGSNNPNRPTYLGGRPNANSGNPSLVPLVSDNFDVSLEYYFARSSYVSAGFFDKRVKNFVGTGQENQNLFGLRDPSSGAAGTRSGSAVTALQGLGADLSDVNLFTMTALIDQTGSVATATAQFNANYVNGNLTQAFIDSTLQARNITANGSDPLFTFQVQKPINNQEGHIYGFEIAGQYFLGDTGFGIAGAYTMVEGDVGYDITAAPSADQFALLGLSDTANASLIYENYGFSAR
jgi:TonB-dependent receptor